METSQTNIKQSESGLTYDLTQLLDNIIYIRITEDVIVELNNSYHHCPIDNIADFMNDLAYHIETILNQNDELPFNIVTDVLITKKNVDLNPEDFNQHITANYIDNEICITITKQLIDYMIDTFNHFVNTKYERGLDYYNDILQDIVSSVFMTNSLLVAITSTHESNTK